MLQLLQLQPWLMAGLLCVHDGRAKCRSRLALHRRVGRLGALRLP